eukprot:2626936-Rhodomonas_salina.1
MSPGLTALRLAAAERLACERHELSRSRSRSLSSSRPLSCVTSLEPSLFLFCHGQGRGATGFPTSGLGPSL